MSSVAKAAIYILLGFHEGCGIALVWLILGTYSPGASLLLIFEENRAPSELKDLSFEVRKFVPLKRSVGWMKIIAI